MKVAIITANTDIYKGTKANESGEAVKLVAEEAGLEVVFMRALPLDREVLSAIMKRLADGKAADLLSQRSLQTGILTQSYRAL